LGEERGKSLSPKGDGRYLLVEKGGGHYPPLLITREDLYPRTLHESWKLERKVAQTQFPGRSCTRLLRERNLRKGKNLKREKKDREFSKKSLLLQPDGE